MESREYNTRVSQDMDFHVSVLAQSRHLYVLSSLGHSRVLMTRHVWCLPSSSLLRLCLIDGVSVGQTVSVYSALKEWHFSLKVGQTHLLAVYLLTVKQLFLRLLFYAVMCLDVFTLKHFNSISVSLWSPYVIGQTIIVLPCGFFLLSSSWFFPRLILAAADWMSTILLHMVACP